MKNIRSFVVFALALFVAFTVKAERYQYDTVPGDRMKVKMYTLPNGLRLYMSVNKDYPRIQTNIAVRVGSKNDPAETTGLAHYFEHLMFKGTSKFGTSDYASEKPLLDEIEQLFETYRVTTDSLERAALYHAIDSVSYLASKLAIPNEYDKLMSLIGSNGTNAYTSYDETCYVEEIPSNQIDNWARIQAQRFTDPVLRGFHTELETIYEEKNMSMTDDTEKLYNKLFEILFPNHPYGRQSILGSQEHLKNPSITNVKKYYEEWYRPNNIAIVMSGDFDPDNAVDIITRYFGDWEPNPNLKQLEYAEETPFTSPQVGEVVGQEAESVMLAWRLPKASDPVMETAEVLGNVVYNGSTGLLDMNVNSKQRTLGVGSGVYALADHSLFLMSGRPKEGQSLDDVRDILLAELAKLRAGDFDEALLPAIINNMKSDEMSQLESNNNRVYNIVGAFINGTPWEQVASSIDRMEKIRKTDVVDFANKYLGDDNYVLLYKRQGKDSTELKIAKPQLTPLEMNRDLSSDFLNEIRNTSVDPIQPVFVDFDKDLTILKSKNDIPVLYKRNDSNDLFTLTYVFETGSNADKLLPWGNALRPLLGTDKKTPEQIKNEFYAMACEYRVSIGERRSYITLSGLSENMDKAMELMEDVLANLKPDKDTWDKLAERNIKSRADQKSDQGASFSALTTYAIYGEECVNNMLSNEELLQADPEALVASLKRLREYPHRIIYYGPMAEKDLLKSIKKYHITPKKFTPVPEGRNFIAQTTPETTIYIAPYDSNQIYMYLFSNNGEKYDAQKESLRKLYNYYFGGDMSSIVFQEMRERRSLAYSASAGYTRPSWLDTPYTYMAFIATQNDKMGDAISAFDEIFNDMPRSEAAFTLAKESLDSDLRTSRTIKDNVAWAYISADDFNEHEPAAKQFFAELPGLTLDDVFAFQQENVKGRTYSYIILGRIEDLDMELLNKLGKVVILTPEQTFGY